MPTVTRRKNFANCAVFLGIQLETMEREAADSGEFDQGVYTQMANALSGILTKLGLGKKGGGGNRLQTLKRRA